MNNENFLPRIMRVGAGSSSHVVDVLAKLGCSKPFIVTDKVMVSLGYVTRITDLLQDADISYHTFSDTVPEPTEASIIAAVSAFKAGDYDSIIALGGGSPIDSAKAISVLGTHGGAMRDYKFPRIVSEQGVPTIAIPTTAGTGSEVTRFTIITDDTVDEKMLCVGLGFMPEATLIDFELTMSLPQRVTADTGIDALTHAIEAYVSKKANLFSDAQALAAMQLIAPNLRRAFNNPEDKDAREKLMMGATLAGIAFSSSSVALVHGMSRPIGALFHVPHGLSNAILLPQVTAYSMQGNSQRYAQCAQAMGVAHTDDNPELACEKLLRELVQLNADLQVPTLAQFGINKQQYFDSCNVMAEQAIASGSPANNPRIPSNDELVSLYESMWIEE